MNQIIIKLNGSDVDFDEISSFPLSITKKTDNFQQVVGGAGDEVSNVFNRLVLPLTNRNINAILDGNIITTISDALYSQFTIIVVVKGSIAFSGTGVLTSVNRTNLGGQAVFQVTGGGTTVWEQLEGVGLREIDMGSTEYTSENVANSNFQLPTTNPVIYAPVIYGITQGNDDPLPPNVGNMFTTFDFRPAVYDYTIFKSIFEDFLGYQIESNFIDSVYFSKWVYMFGVGEDWLPYADLELNKLHAERQVLQQIAPSGSTFFPVRLTTEINDPSDIYSQLTFEATIPETGVWSLEAFIEVINDNRTILNVIDPVSPSPDAYGNFGNAFLPLDMIGYYFSGNVTLRQGAIIQFLVRPSSTAVTADISFASLKLELSSDIIPESVVSVSSCLHDADVKSYLRGVFHRHNLVAFVNNVTKRAYIEPRFDWFSYDGAGNLVRNEGWYKNPSEANPILKQIDSSNVEIIYFDDFGEYIRMGYQQGSDPLDTFYSLSHNIVSINFYSTKIPLNNKGKSGTNQYNPYFHLMYLGYSNTIASRGNALPMILPEGTNIAGDVLDEKGLEVIGALPDPDYKSQPKCGYIQRNATFVVHEDSIGQPYERADHALIIQANTIERNPSFLITDKNSGGYSKTTRYLRVTEERNGEVSSPPDVSFGLVDCFYRTWLSIIKNGRKINVFENLLSNKVASENFRNLAVLRVGGKETLAVLNEIKDFKPLLAELTQSAYYQYIKEEQDFLDSFEDYDINEPPFSHIYQ